MRCDATGYRADTPIDALYSLLPVFAIYNRHGAMQKSAFTLTRYAGGLFNRGSDGRRARLAVLLTLSALLAAPAPTAAQDLGPSARLLVSARNADAAGVERALKDGA